MCLNAIHYYGICLGLLFFFFKQKTAYEMRISDWSSDVCSSDLMRRFWRGDRGMIGALATRLAGSSDIFHGAAATRTVNFLAAHDGCTLADLTAYEHRRNEANGDHNSEDRKSGVVGKGVSQRFELGRGCDIKQKKQSNEKK